MFSFEKKSVSKTLKNLFLIKYIVLKSLLNGIIKHGLSLKKKKKSMGRKLRNSSRKGMVLQFFTLLINYDFNITTMSSGGSYRVGEFSILSI